MKIQLAILILCLVPVFATAQNEEVEVPADVKPFVEKGYIPIALESGDLNGDGTKDFILVLSKPTHDRNAYDEAGDANRPTLILVRDAGGKLSLAARNDAVAFCKNCGGVMGDPFQGIAIKGTSFSVSNYGGSNERWGDDYTFGYSRRDNQWQLTRVEETTFNALAPTNEKKRVLTPPKNFGLITFPDFNPESFRGKGKK